MKAYGLPEGEWRDDWYGRTSKYGRVRSKPKREARRTAKRQKRQRAEIEARQQHDDMDVEHDE